MSTTWDGLPIADDQPHGAAVVVRRPGPAGPEYLLLHRAHEGPDFEGDWAWTSPTGARFPGEPVYVGALRELAEEAGLTGHAPTAVDLSGGWAVFLLDVGASDEVELVDPEHDRYAWVSADDAAARVLPAAVGADQVHRTRDLPFVTITHRPMVTADIATVTAWRSTPHVARWFPPRDDLADLLARRVAGPDPVAMTVAEVDQTPAASLQCYRLGDLVGEDAYVEAVGDPDAVAIDYLIGEPTLAGRGLGTMIIWDYLREVVRLRHPTAATIIASPDVGNLASARVLEKCGFRRGRTLTVPFAGGVRTEVLWSLDVERIFGASGPE